MKVTFVDQQITRTYAILAFFPNIWRYCHHQIFFKLFNRNYRDIYDLEMTLYYKGNAGIYQNQRQLLVELQHFYKVGKQFYEKELIPPEHLSLAQKCKMRKIKQYNKNLNFNICGYTIYQDFEIRDSTNKFEKPFVRFEVETFFYNQRSNFGNKKYSYEYLKENYPQKLLKKNSRQKTKRYENNFSAFKLYHEQYQERPQKPQEQERKVEKTKLQLFLQKKDKKDNKPPYQQFLAGLQEQWRKQEENKQKKERKQRQRQQDERIRKQFYLKMYEGCQHLLIKEEDRRQIVYPEDQPSDIQEAMMQRIRKQNRYQTQEEEESQQMQQDVESGDGIEEKKYKGFLESSQSQDYFVKQYYQSKKEKQEQILVKLEMLEISQIQKKQIVHVVASEKQEKQEKVDQKDVEKVSEQASDKLEDKKCEIVLEQVAEMISEQKKEEIKEDQKNQIVEQKNDLTQLEKKEQINEQENQVLEEKKQEIIQEEFVQKIEQKEKIQQKPIKENKTKIKFIFDEPEENEEEQMVQKIDQNKYSVQSIRNCLGLYTNKQVLQNITPSVIDQSRQIRSWERKLQKNQKSQQQNKLQKNIIKINIDTNKNKKEQKQKQKPQEHVLGFGKKVKKNTIEPLMLGKNISKDTLKKKEELKQQAKRQNFVKQQQKKIESLEIIQQKKIQAAFQLNKIAPQSLDYVFQEVKKFVTESEEECRMLIDLIIEKAVSQTKYAACFADLSAKLAKINNSEYKYKVESKKKKSFFRVIFYEKVQYILDQNEIEKSEVLNDESKKILKTTMVGNVQFLAELMRKNLINLGIAPRALVCLIIQFFKEYILYEFEKKDEYSIYLYQFEYIIRFVETLGKEFEEINKNQVFSEEKLKICKGYITDYCNGKGINDNIEFIKAATGIHSENFFALFEIMDQKILKVKDNRLSSLLKNLTERVSKKWIKHLSQAEVPKKLNQIDKEQVYEKQQKMVEKKVENQLDNEGYLAQLSSEMKKILKEFQNNNKNWEKLLEQMVKKRKIQHIYFTFFRVAPEQVVQKIAKTIQIFEYLLENHYSESKFQAGWNSAVKFLAFECTDIPFCSALMAKSLIMVKQKYKVEWKNYFLTFDEDQEEDEKYYLDQVFQKLYHYSKDKDVLCFVDENKNLKKLL